MSDLGPSLVDGRLRYVSPSQIEKYDDRLDGGCARKWWFRYVARVPDDDKPAARLGEQVHEQLEHFARSGDDAGLGPIAAAGRRFVPRTDGSKLNLELAFGQNFGASVVSPLYAAGVPVIGRIDAISTSNYYLDEHGEEHYIDGIEVIDWKTTGYVLDVVNEVTGAVMWKGRAKTAAQIASSWQMLAYGEVARRIYDPLQMRLSHVYFQTKRPYLSVKRTAPISPATVAVRWAAADELVDRMASTAGEAAVKAVPANLAACSAFGGCPYKNKCPRDARAVFSNLFGGDRVSILERRRAQAVAAGAGNAAGPGAEQPSTPTQETRDVPGLPPETGRSAPAAAGRALADPLPPGRCPMSGRQRTLPPFEVVEKKHKCVCGAELKVKPVTMPDDTSRAVVPEHDAGVAPEKLKKIAKAKVEEVVVEHKDTGDSSGYSLYVDCLDRDVPTQPLSIYAALLASDIAEQFSVVDVRCAPNDSALGFGRWRGALAAAARDTPPVGAFYARTGDEISDVVWQALEPKARVFVRGVK